MGFDPFAGGVVGSLDSETFPPNSPRAAPQ